MKKKFLTVALTATMALGCAVSAFAAEPAASYGFDGDTGISLNGEAAITANPDDSSDKVLCVETGAGGKNGNYALVEAGFLSGKDFSNGATISMNIRPTLNSSDWNYVFCLGASGKATDVNASGFLYVDGTIGFITRHGDPYEAHFPGGAWAEGNNVNSAFDYFTNAANTANCNKWYKITYVYSKTNISIYVDGVLATSWAPTQSMDDILNNLGDKAALVLGAGASRGDLENFGGYIDDVIIYNSALTADEVKAIPEKVVKEEESSSEPESTTQNSPDGGDAETSEQESTTQNSPSGGDEETSADDTTTGEVPTTGGEDETTTEAPTTPDAGVVSAEDVAKIAKDAVIADAPEGAKLEVNAITEDAADYSVAKKFVADELKAKAWAVLDLKLVKDDVAIQPDGKMKITLPLFENLKDAKYVAVYRLNADTDKFDSLGTVEVKDGKFTFTTDHFSTYLFASADKPATDDTLDGDNGKTGDTAPVGVIMAVALAAVGAVVLVSTKKKNA